MNISAMGLIAFGYLLGSVPFALLYSLQVVGDDVREKGSGNIGATNVGRNYGWFGGLSVLLLDFLKGAVPVGLAFYLLGSTPAATLTGVAAVAGHIFPVYLGFNGGKGVATSAGVFAVLVPVALLVALGFFLLGLTSRYMAIGSLLGALSLPAACVYFYSLSHPASSAALLLAAVVFYRHRGNIFRLIKGQENRLY